MQRAMVLDFGHDDASRGVADQFMYGSALLVAPIYKSNARHPEPSTYPRAPCGTTFRWDYGIAGECCGGTCRSG